MPSLEIPPGVSSGPTKASKSSQWKETHLMRWVGGQLTPIGGWEKLNYAAFPSKIRKIHSWVTNSGLRATAYLCEAHCFVDLGGGVQNISPTTPIVPPFSNVVAGGFGDDDYSYDDYGTPRPDRPEKLVVGPVYSMDNWGEDLIVMTSTDGRLLRWSPSTPSTPLTIVPNAPENNRAFVVTPERHVICFGYDANFSDFAWSDQEDIENWNFADVTGKAGFLGIEPKSPIVAVCKTSNGTLVFTTKKTHIVRFVGSPYVYSVEELVDAATPISPSAVAAVGEGAYWYCGTGGFWAFNGSSVSPVQSPVHDWVTDDFDDLFGRLESCAVNMNELSEWWLFFPSDGSQSNNRYIIFNYSQGWWATGYMGRNCGNSVSFEAKPLMATDYEVFRHESGGYYQGADLPWARTFTLNIAGGAVLSTVGQMIPDIEGNVDNIAFSFQYRDNRSRAAFNQSRDYLVRQNGFVDIRLTGRDFNMMVKCRNAPVENWTLGNSEIKLTNRGAK